MICTKCGHNNVAEARFCEECGSPLGGAAPQQPSYTPPQPSYGMPQQNFGGMQPPRPQGSPGFGIASMVCGIVALVTACCIPYLPIILALVGVVLGGVGLRGNRRGKGMAIAGLVTSIIALVPTVIVIVTGSAIISGLSSL